MTALAVYGVACIGAACFARAFEKEWLGPGYWLFVIGVAVGKITTVFVQATGLK